METDICQDLEVKSTTKNSSQIRLEMNTKILACVKQNQTLIDLYRREAQLNTTLIKLLTTIVETTDCIHTKSVISEFLRDNVPHGDL